MQFVAIAIDGAINMAAKRLAAYIDHGVVVVPIPLAVARAIGCRPNTVVHLHRVDGELRVLTHTAGTPDAQKSTPNASPMWESCRNWWRKCGSSVQNSGPQKALPD